MSPEPIVAEIRAVRAQVAADCNYDFHQICLRGEEVLRQWNGKIVTKEELDRSRDKRWHESFAKSQDKLVAAARKAKEDIAQGLATPLDLDQL